MRFDQHREPALPLLQRTPPPVYAVNQQKVAHNAIVPYSRTSGGFENHARRRFRAHSTTRRRIEQAA
jgi:hypothetical protein